MGNKLSPVLQFTDDFQESINTAYEYFAENIANRAHRPALFEKEVFIECSETINDRPVGFWHIISLDDKHGFAKIVPCTNDPTIDLCNQNCVTRECQISIRHNTENRNLCLYRASRLPWIIDLIKMANRDDPDVKVWLKPGGKKASDKLYLRFKRSGNDFVVIFSAERRFYRLISAFPVFFLNEKRELDDDYNLYHWSYFKK